MRYQNEAAVSFKVDKDLWRDFMHISKKDRTTATSTLNTFIRAVVEEKMKDDPQHYNRPTWSVQ